MLKVRVIPILLLKNGRMIKPIQFGAGGERDVGYPETTARIYDSQDADELIFIDIDATSAGRKFLTSTLAAVAKSCFVPITAGGGIRNLLDIRDILKAGADKVTINTEAILNPGFITRASKIFGTQCIVVSIDAKRKKPGKYDVFIEHGSNDTGYEVLTWAKKAEQLGAGELLLTSIGQEGTMKGYDLELIKMVAQNVSIPVIANGGAGTRADFVSAVKIGGASAVAASSVFHFSDSNLTQVKSFLYNSNVSIRPI